MPRGSEDPTRPPDPGLGLETRCATQSQRTAVAQPRGAQGRACVSEPSQVQNRRVPTTRIPPCACPSLPLGTPSAALSPSPGAGSRSRRAQQIRQRLKGRSRTRWPSAGPAGEQVRREARENKVFADGGRQRPWLHDKAQRQRHSPRHVRTENDHGDPEISSRPDGQGTESGGMRRHAGGQPAPHSLTQHRAAARLAGPCGQRRCPAVWSTPVQTGLWENF